MPDQVRSWRERIRERQLAGDTRAGAWVRAEAARRQRKFLAENWLPFGGVTAVIGLGIAGVAFLAPPGFLRGLVVGAMSAGFIAALFVLILEETGTAATRMGATAEQRTAGELRPLVRHGWRLINHFTGENEIDHLLIGPAGIVVAETKWSRSAWRREPNHRQLRWMIRRLKATAQEVERWEEVRQTSCLVRPALFLWSAEHDEAFGQAESTTFLDGVAVIYGRREAAGWRTRVLGAETQLTADVIRELVEKMSVRLAEGDEREATRSPAPPTLNRLYWTLFACFGAGIAGMMSLLEPLAAGLYWLAAVVGFVGLAVGFYVRSRFRPLRLIADAWLTGLIAIGIFATVLIATW